VNSDSEFTRKIEAANAAHAKRVAQIDTRYRLKLWTVFVIAAIASMPLSCRSAHGQIMAPAKAEVLRRCFPATEDRDLLAIINDPDLLLYSESEMPACFSANQGSLKGAFANSNNIAANFDPIAASKGISGNVGSANREFPWVRPGGTDRVTNLRTFRFLKLPKASNGVRWPVAVWSATLPEDSGPTLGWTFPEDATLGEALCIRSPTGLDHCFEIRTRTKAKTFWDVAVYRSYSTPEKLGEAIAKLRPGQSLPELGNLQAFRFADDQPRKSIIRQDAAVDYLPDLRDDELVSQLLLTASFENVHGQVWRRQGSLVSHAPSTKARFHIVPAEYLGCAVEVSAQSCARCHSTVGHNAAEFALNGTGNGRREWYGKVRSNGDGIFSFHPYSIDSISRDGANRPVRLRKELLDAGVIAAFDPKVHVADKYRRIAEFDPMTNSKPPASIRNTISAR